MATKLIRSIYNMRPEVQGGVVTIGNFDGVMSVIRRWLKA